MLFIQNKCCISAYAVLLFIYRKGVTLLTTGERIKARRKELGISADQLASRIGVSRATMFRYENGAIEKVPSYVLALIASALNIDPVYLLLGYSDSSSQPDPPHNPEIEELVALAESSTPEEVQQIIRIFRAMKGA